MRDQVSMKTNALEFTYVNWRGDSHEYLIYPQEIQFMHVVHSDKYCWVIHGYFVTRDSDPRPELIGPARRRSFELTKMENMREVIL